MKILLNVEGTIRINLEDLSLAKLKKGKNVPVDLMKTPELDKGRAGNGRQEGKEEGREGGNTGNTGERRRGQERGRGRNKMGRGGKGKKRGGGQD